MPRRLAALVLPALFGVTSPSLAQAPRHAASSSAPPVDLATCGERLIKLTLERRNDEAHDLARRCSELANRTLPLGDPTRGKMALAYAVTLSTIGDHAAARAAYERVLENETHRIGPNHRDLAPVLGSLALMCDMMGDAQAAAVYWKQSVALRERVEGESIGLAEDLNYLGLAQQSAGQLVEAEAAIRRSLSLATKLAGKRAPVAIAALNNLGLVLASRGAFAEAAAALEESLELHATAEAAKAEGVCTALANLGWIYMELARFDDAEEALDRALQESCVSDGSREIALSRAQALYNLALVYATKHDFKRAEPLLQDVLTLRERLLGAEHSEMLAPLNGLAALRASRGDFQGAEETFRRVLRMSETLYGADSHMLSLPLQNLAATVSRLGRRDEAERLWNRALSLSERGLGPDHPKVAGILQHLGTFKLEVGDTKSATLLLERALKISERGFGQRHPKVAQVLDLLASAQLTRGDWRASVATRERQTSIEEDVFAAVLAAGSEAQKRAFADAMHRGVSDVLALHSNSPPADARAARLALETLVRRKGRVLDAMVDSVGVLRRMLGDEERALLDQLTAARGEIASLSLGPEVADLPERLKEAEDRVQALEVAISRRSGALKVAEQPVTVSALQAALPEGSVLVEIGSFRPFTAKQGENPRWGKSRYVAYGLGRRGEPWAVELGDVAEIDRAVLDFREKIRSPRTDYREAAERLDALLLRPIAARIATAKLVFFSPEGALNLVPLGALVDERGKVRAESHLFNYLSSGRDLLRLQGAAAQPREGAVIVADPAFDTPLSPGAKESEPSAGASAKATRAGAGANRCTDSLRSANFPMLEGTRAEGAAVAALTQAERLLTGEAARQDALQSLQGPRILHIATHGFFLEDAPPTSTSSSRALVLADDFPAKITPRRTSCEENPLLRSGLVFAGASARAGGGGQGLLTAMEASALDLYGTKLVVLSACETGLGAIANGEGVFGLRRAFAMAGAEAQVMSLWAVDDEATRDLMVGYYERLTAGAGRVEALRDAQLAIMKGGRAHPYYWAAFIPSGAWAPLEGQASGETEESREEPRSSEPPTARPETVDWLDLRLFRVGSKDPRFTDGTLGAALGYESTNLGQKTVALAVSSQAQLGADFEGSFLGDLRIAVGPALNLGPISVAPFLGVGINGWGGEAPKAYEPFAGYWSVEGRARLQLRSFGADVWLSRSSRAGDVSRERSGHLRLYYGPPDKTQYGLGVRITEFVRRDGATFTTTGALLGLTF